MNLPLCLGDILSDFRHLFNQQNFALFQAFIFGFIANNGRGTLTELYQSSGSETQYWSFPKFLSRGQWNADAVAALLIRRIQRDFPSWVYVYDKGRADKDVRCRCSTRRHPNPSESLKTVSVFLRLYNRFDA